MSGTRLTLILFAQLCVLVVPGCMAPDGGYGYEPAYRYEDGGTGAGGRRYSRAHVEREWIGATYDEVLDHWGEPYSRMYWDIEVEGDRTYGYGPYMAYVEVVRDPVGGRAGEIEHIYFILDDDFHRVVRVEFSDTHPWSGGEVSVHRFHEW